MQSEFYLSHKVIEIAKKIVNDDIDPIEGARFIVDNRWNLNVPGEDKIFYPLIGFVSETDTMPVGDVRNTFSKESLAKSDKKKEEYLQRISGKLKKSCIDLIELLSKESRN